MVCKKAREILNKKITEEEGEFEDEQKRNECFERRICPSCASTNFKKTFIGKTWGMEREWLNRYNLKCIKCGDSKEIHVWSLFDKKEK